MVSNEDHIASKNHRKIKTQYYLTNSDDINCIMEFKPSGKRHILKVTNII